MLLLRCVGWDISEQPTHPQAIALQTRHIVDEMNARGHVIDSIYMSGKLPQVRSVFQQLALLRAGCVLVPSVNRANPQARKPRTAR